MLTTRQDKSYNSSEDHQLTPDEFNNFLNRVVSFSTRQILCMKTYLLPLLVYLLSMYGFLDGGLVALVGVGAGLTTTLVQLQARSAHRALEARTTDLSLSGTDDSNYEHLGAVLDVIFVHKANIVVR